MDIRGEFDYSTNLEASKFRLLVRVLATLKAGSRWAGNIEPVLNSSCFIGSSFVE